ncbi:protein DpdF [Burkholderia cenocepacia]|uniref:protein DpdF n=1 Tax=Burkholderia cenocepacia TaxID=95486 RepID=UPI002ABD17B0|nr:protein DpdF [Burkholderia cenocepacia]
MKRDFFGDAEVRECLADWPRARKILTTHRSTGLTERLRQVLLRYSDARTQRSHVELVALLRQWLLVQTSRGGAQWMRVPSDPTWPDRHRWEEAGFTVVAFGSGLEIQASAPRLPWLGAQCDLFDEVHTEVHALNRKWVAAEPIVGDTLGLPYFTGAGQREAVRSLLHLPKDITLLAALPTGSGKSLLAQLPPLLDGEGHLTLAIVPTVALAIDQGDRMAELFRRKDANWQEIPLAYHGDLTLDQRSAIYRAVNAGTQRILFTSPEAATGSLRRLLEDCAKVGRLTHVVVDEAHLVATWGSGFRPAFQLLPALISRLRALAPHAIRVVLASATLTAHTIKVLQRQFGPPEKTQLISGVYLRPEPRYAARYCATLADKQHRVVEALKVAPRPFILYVTRPAEAEYWLCVLRAEGFERIAQFTGETQGGMRKTLLGQWKRDELDGMIATSAFGLGVDKSDVRTVVHATLPESLDRFYQEVGRSGRDGIASASLLLYTDEDFRQALSLAGTRYIGNDIAFERWTTLIDHAVAHHAQSGDTWVDLRLLRPELNIRGKTNLEWNLRTLNLMACAGLIDIAALAANRPDAAGNFDGDLDESDTLLTYAAVRIPNADHRSRAIFDEKMQRARSDARRASREAFELMRSIARNERPVEEALGELYRVSLANVFAPVRPYCGGCKSHWPERSLTPVVPSPFVARLDRFAERLDFREALRGVPRAVGNMSFVVVDDVSRMLQQTTPGLLDALISRLRPHTIAMARETSTECLDLMRARLRRLRSDAFVDLFDPAQTDALEGGVQEVRVVILSSESISQAENSALKSSPCEMTVVILPKATRDPDRPDRLWSSVLAHTDEESLIRVLTT